MENDFWNNPGLKNMSPEKLQYPVHRPRNRAACHPAKTKHVKRGI